MDGLSVEHIQELRHAFSYCDTDSDGFISIRELGALMRRLGQSVREQELKEMIFQIHPDGIPARTPATEKEYGLSFDDFMSIMYFSLRGVSDHEFDSGDGEKIIKETFRLFDGDGDGFITANELRTLMTNLGENLTGDEINEMIKVVDTDGDGKVNYEDFKRLMSFRQ